MEEEGERLADLDGNDKRWQGLHMKPHVMTVQPSLRPGSCIYKCLSSGLTLLEGAYVGVVAMDLDRERENEVGDGPFRVSGTKLP